MTATPSATPHAPTRTLAWGVLGAGAIAKAFVRGVSQSRLNRIVAVGSRARETAERFGDEHDIQVRHADYHALLADSRVDAIYIATPHPLHAQWAIRAARAGKHLLVEKPFTLNFGDAMTVTEAAREHAVFLMEAFMYRCHPQTARLVELIRGGTIGEIKLIQASFGFRAAVNPGSRLFDPALGGGGILDIGAYPVSMARLLAGAAQNKPFADPDDVVGLGRLGQTGVDEYAAAILKFNTPHGEIIAQLAASVTASLDNTLRIFGTEGAIEVPNPWTADRQHGGHFTINVRRQGATEQITLDTDRTAFSYEVDAAAEAILAGARQPAPPAMTWDDTLGNMRTLDRWRQAIRLTYPAEMPGAPGAGRTAAGEPLRRRAEHSMRYANIAHLDKPVSRLIIGCDHQTDFPAAAALWDDWFERGGNAFDTAFAYGGGHQERLLAQWVRSRGVREHLVITIKGAHTPDCNPPALTRQLLTSLERLGMDAADIYIMHRDNPEVPVSEFMDVLNEHASAGRFKAFGASNWTLPRFREAQEYAQKRGLQPMSILNNNLSLARMVKPLWPGCISSSDAEFRRYLEDTQTAHFAWSSQARGYFLPEGERLKLGQKNFECWDAPDNRARRDRAEALARARGVSAINIAAAYVLNQPFPSFALIGPRTLRETATALPALDLTLSRNELAYLNLDADSPA